MTQRSSLLIPRWNAIARAGDKRRWPCHLDSLFKALQEHAAVAAKNFTKLSCTPAAYPRRHPKCGAPPRIGQAGHHPFYSQPNSVRRGPNSVCRRLLLPMVSNST